MLGTIGEIRGFAGNFAPRNWAICSGQLMSIGQNQALYTILGTTYGGDGIASFALPDLRGRIPISAGRGPGLSNRILGQRSGQEYALIDTLSMPAHTHSSTFVQGTGNVDIAVVNDTANTDSPAGAHLAIPEIGGSNMLYSDGFPGTSLGTGSTAQIAGRIQNSPTGGSQEHYNMQPYLTINWIICLFGNFPSRT